MFKEVAFIFSCSRSSSDFPPNGTMIIWHQISSHSFPGPLHTLVFSCAAHPVLSQAHRLLLPQDVSTC